ncbi:Ppx/GppA phosphatase family protein [Dyadobacter sp. OTU695]|uniref:Ppx/GppA phosphatase family protein n=1 Tax=Dyadobacter sp. OTU695 TaxID=3043860 RepID=UPI00313EDDF7
MKRLTVAGRLIITVLILGAIFVGYKYFGGQKALNQMAEDQAQTPQTEATTGEAESTASDPGTSPNSEAATSAGSAFTYTPPVPVDGKLKGVVELGASGFNSFIITVDKEKRWKLEKSEFGNSLVTENMATDEDVRIGLKKYIGTMLDYGVGSKDIHFVVSSGAAKAEVTTKITRVLKSLGYVVNQVSAEQEGQLALKSVLPAEYADKAFVVDIGSGNTKISWIDGGKISALESYGAKYFQDGTDDSKVYQEVSDKAKQIPANLRNTCFIIGGVPFEMAKEVRKGKERYTTLSAPLAYSKLTNAKSKAGVNIYKAVTDATGCQQFVFDWDANFTIGFLLGL